MSMSIIRVLSTFFCIKLKLSTVQWWRFECKLVLAIAVLRLSKKELPQPSLVCLCGTIQCKPMVIFRLSMQGHLQQQWIIFWWVKLDSTQKYSIRMDQAGLRLFPGQHTAFIGTDAGFGDFKILDDLRAIVRNFSETLNNQLYSEM